MPELVREWHLDPGPPAVTVRLFDDGTLKCTCPAAERRRPGLMGSGCAHVTLLENFAAALWDTRVAALRRGRETREHMPANLERTVPPTMFWTDTRNACKNASHKKPLPPAAVRLISLPEGEE